jgi:hypothetical protein
MNNVKYSQTNSNFALAICTNEIKKAKNQSIIQSKFRQLRNLNPKITPQRISYNTVTKGNLSKKYSLPT